MLSVARFVKRCLSRESDFEGHRLSVPDPAQQIIDLEMTVAHLEHELEQMHSVLLAVQSDMKAMQDHLAKLERRISVAGEPQEELDPQMERPPHY